MPEEHENAGLKELRKLLAEAQASESHQATYVKTKSAEYQKADQILEELHDRRVELEDAVQLLEDALTKGGAG